MFYGSGRSGCVEATAAAVLALMADGHDTNTCRAALAWLAANKDGRGTWGLTQATVLAIKAQMVGTGKPLGGDRPRSIAIDLDGTTARELEIPADQAEVVRQVDLSARFVRGSHRLRLTDRSETESTFPVIFRYHIPEDRKSPGRDGPLEIRVEYDRTSLAVGDFVSARATVEYRGPDIAPMVVLELPIPGGFALERDGLDRLVAAGQLARCQVAPRRVTVYIRGLASGRPLSLPYRLRATMPVKLNVPAAQAYEYFDPDRRGSSAPATLSVTP